MKTDTPSASARVAATLRALHQRLPDGQRLMQDSCVDTFVAGRIGRVIIRSPRLTKWVISLKPTASMLIAARDRFADDWARKTLNGPSQLLLLGAGYDPMSQRLAPDYPETVFFEIDHPATLRAKQMLLTTKQLLLPPERQKFVASNFERTDLRDGLLAGGYNQSLPSFVNWMGVTYYLPLEAIHQTLATLSDLLAPGSILTLDFLQPDGNHQQSRWGKILKLFSEPLKTFLVDDDVVAIAAQYRFEPAELFPANDYARRFSSSADLNRIFGRLAAFRRLPG